MSIRGLHHVSLLVRDTARALAFYQQLLGLEIDARRPDLGYAGAWLQVGKGQIHLIEAGRQGAEPSAPAPVARDRHVALAVVGLGRVQRRLEEAGVACTPSRSGRRALFCRDPDGNGLELIEAE